VSAEVERLRAQHADAVWEKSAADSKCRKLADKVAALESERTDLRRQLAEERKEANEALAKAQSAQAEANLARAEGSLARSWARGPLTSKCQTESPDFAASSGCRRSCWRSPPLWRDLCPMPPWSPAKGR
jgi:hypothetical protein